MGFENTLLANPTYQDTTYDSSILAARQSWSN